jgi:E3 ubiquitin-protein ligase RNF14
MCAYDGRGKSENVSEMLEVLKSIYPELQISSKNDDLSYDLSIVNELLPNRNVRFELVRNDPLGGLGDGKVLEFFESGCFEGIKFRCGLPLNEDDVEIRSCWIDDDTLRSITNDIRQLITVHEVDKDETADEELLFSVFDLFMNEISFKYESDIFSNYLIQTTSEARFKSYRSMTQRARMNEFKKNRFSCSICLESKDGETDGVLLDCDHCFCKECLKEYFQQIIDSDDVLRLQCANCPIEPLKNFSEKTTSELKGLLFKDKIDFDVFKQVQLDNDYQQKYFKLLELSRFEKFRTVYPFSCSECPRCSRWIFRENVDDKLMHCGYCKLAYCFDCNHSWHGKNNACGWKMNTIPRDILEKVASGECTDSELKRFQQVYGRQNLKLAVDSLIADKLFFETVSETDELVKCPNCNTVVTKSDGCNKMQCVVCSENFCYLCGESLTKGNPYEHYNDHFSPCYGKLFEGMPGVEEDQILQ